MGELSLIESYSDGQGPTASATVDVSRLGLLVSTSPSSMVQIKGYENDTIASTIITQKSYLFPVNCRCYFNWQHASLLFVSDD